MACAKLIRAAAKLRTVMAKKSKEDPVLMMSFNQVIIARRYLLTVETTNIPTISQQKLKEPPFIHRIIRRCFLLTVQE